ncbi:MAG: chorismate lyase, partial [Betaproteobacteria bacterium]|nr:chorismate lyase [Betaproteobacteria bacterium]
WRGLRGLGSRPLAEALFTDPLVARGPLEFVRIDARHPLGRRVRQVFGRDFPVLWARRSRFVKHGRPLLVTEVFLPELLALR